MPVFCRNCKSANLKAITRKRYLVIAAFYFFAAAIILMVRLSLPAASHLVLSLLTILIVIAVIACLRCVLYAAMQVTPSYKCRACGYYFWRANT
jgi:hypothetical protein